MRAHHNLPSPPKGNVSCAGRLLHHQLPYHSITASQHHGIDFHRRYTTYMYTHAYTCIHMFSFNTMLLTFRFYINWIYLYMSDRPQGTDLTLVFSLSSFSIFFPLPSISVRSFSSPLKPRNPPNSWIRWTVDGGRWTCRIWQTWTWWTLTPPLNFCFDPKPLAKMFIKYLDIDILGFVQ